MRRGPAAALGLLTAALLGACSEGYQGDGPPLRLHYDMSRQEALSALGQVARAVSQGARTYALQEHCVLEWRQDRSLHRTPLRGTEAVLAKHVDERGYSVRLVPAGGTQDAGAVVLLEQAPWAEATQKQWLLNYLRRFC